MTGFPSQDLLPAGGVGNLIAAPLFKPARDNGATVFLDLATLKRHEDQRAATEVKCATAVANRTR